MISFLIFVRVYSVVPLSIFPWFYLSPLWTSRESERKREACSSLYISFSCLSLIRCCYVHSVPIFRVALQFFSSFAPNLPYTSLPSPLSSTQSIILFYFTCIFPFFSFLRSAASFYLYISLFYLRPHPHLFV